jgi:hypothetical protein
LTVPEWISILVGNGLIQIGMAIYARAIYRFVAQSEPPRWITGFTVLALIAWL